jgi:SWI/SNF-related matrix-associated actin-dependent regulator of chromatin subfamily D
MEQIFNAEHIMFYQIPELIKPYLLDLAPITLPYTIRCDKVFHAIKPPTPTIYDVRVPLPDSLRQQMSAIAASPLHTATLTAISRIDDRVALVMQVIQASKARHGFLTNLSKDPVNFTKRWISSQQRDLEVILGKGAWSEDEWQGAEWRKGGAGVWSSTEAHESVGSFLSRMKA